MKKTLLFFLVTILCLVMLYSCTSTCEKENPVSDFEYTENEDGGITITKYKGERTEVVIPDKINEKTVTAIGPKAFMLGTEYDPIESPITQVDIPDTVTHIGECAFYYCTRLKEFVPPKNLEVVGDFAFAGCASIKNVQILSSVTYGIGVFGYSGVESADVEDGTTYINRHSFGETKLQEIKLPSSVKVIEQEAFRGCIELETVTLNEGLERVGKGAFEYCYELKEIIIPQTVTAIEEYAFADCTELKTAVILEGVETIGDFAFAMCSQLENIELPKSIKEIGHKAFFECQSLKHIYLSASVNYGANVFSSSGIESVKIEEGTTVIPERVFSNTKIKDVTLPKSVEIIEPSAFYGCDELISVNLNQGLKEISQSVFVHCSKLTEIIIPETVTELGEDAFWECENLKGVKFEGNAPELSEAQLKEASKTYHTVYYHEGAVGFTSPEWEGLPTEIW